MNSSSRWITVRTAVALTLLWVGAARATDAESGATTAAPAHEPAAVSGHVEEINTGTFDLVDGIAYRAAGGTVVFVTAEPIASASLAGSPCPATHARSLALLRDSPFAEVTLDAAGQSSYFLWGTPFGGRGRAERTADESWVSASAEEGGRARGRARHPDYGGFTFDLPVLTAVEPGVSETDVMDGRLSGTSTPAEAALLAAYEALRAAARAGDLGAFLATQGFTAEQVEAVRALPGIAEDLAGLAGRFLDPGTPEESTLEVGHASLGARGKNPRGEEFFNFYRLVPCGRELVLVAIGENPQ